MQTERGRLRTEAMRDVLRAKLARREAASRQHPTMAKPTCPTGRLWAGEHWNTAPDILCLAKGIAGGVPMGATLVRPFIFLSVLRLILL